MKREFEAVRELLIRGTRQVKLTEIWYQIHRELNLGKPTDKGTLALTEEEKNYLRQWIRDVTGVDPLLREHLPGAKRPEPGAPIYHKATPREAFGRMLRLAREGGGAIRLRSGEARVPRGAILNVEPQALHLEQEKLVVVDDGKLVRDWAKLQFPAELKGALIVFRGQERDALTLLSVLDECQPAMNVGFYDFDPEGLRLGILAEHDALLVPARWIEMNQHDPFFQLYNQNDRFTAQVDALVFLQGRVPGSLQAIVHHMRSHKMALMQEHLVEQQEPLMLVPIVS